MPTEGTEPRLRDVRHADGRVTKAIRHMLPEGELDAGQRDGLSQATRAAAGDSEVPAGGWEGPYRADLGQGFVTNAIGESFWMGPGANLSHRDLSGVSAPRADLSGALIVGCRGRNVDLSEARFDGATVHDLHLVGSSLASSQWGGTKVTKMRVEDSSMGGLVAEGFRWDDVAVFGSDCDGILLSEGTLSGFTAENSSLANASFAHLRVHRAGIYGCPHAQGMRFMRSSVNGLRIAGTDARHSEWDSVEAHDVEVLDSRLEGGSFYAMLSRNEPWMVDDRTTYDALPGNEALERPEVLERLRDGSVAGHLVGNGAVLPSGFDWEGRPGDFHVPTWELRKRW